MIDTLLFDFFGTLVDYSVYGTEVGFKETHDYLNRNGVTVEYEHFASNMGTAFESLDIWSREHQKEYSMRNVCIRFFEERNFPDYSEDLIEGLIARYIREWCLGVTPIPEVKEMIERLSSDFKLGVVSNTHHLPLVPGELAKAGIKDYFDVIITSVEHGRPKPHASIYESALISLDAAPERTLFIGDSYEPDFDGPTKFGMQAILISENPPSEVPGRCVVKSILEVESLVRDFSLVGKDIK